MELKHYMMIAAGLVAIYLIYDITRDKGPQQAVGGTGVPLPKLFGNPNTITVAGHSAGC